MRQIRVLLIDESVVRRDLLRASLSDERDLELVGAAPNSRTGLARAEQFRPDVVVLSTTIGDQPTDGLARELLQALPDSGVLLLGERSASAVEADRIVRTLEAGAFDLVFRFDGPDRDPAHAAALTRGLLPKIRAFSAARYSRMARRLSGAGPSVGAEADPGAAARVASRLKHPRGAVQVVTLGVSTGGPEALSRLIPELPGSFPVPLVVVIHMPSPFSGALAAALDRDATLSVREAQEGQALGPGVYLAPGGRHLGLARSVSGALIARLSDEAPENGCKPAADVLFRSAAAACPGGVVAVIMTGMGTDGAKGLAAVKHEGGGYVLAQDEGSSIVWGMPGSAVRAGVVDEVLPLDRIAERLLALVRPR